MLAEQELKLHCMQTVAELEQAVNQYNARDEKAGLTAALGLEQLLCRRQGEPEVSQIRAVVPNAAFHAVWLDLRHETQLDACVPCFHGSPIGHDAGIVDPKGPRIAVEAWLEQGIAAYHGRVLTIRQLIRDAVNEARNTEPDWFLLATYDLFGRVEDFRSDYICAVAAYVAREVREQLGFAASGPESGPGKAHMVLIGLERTQRIKAPRWFSSTWS